MEAIALFVLGVTFIAGGSLISYYAILRLWKGGVHFHPEKNPNGTPNYKNRKDVCDIPIEHSHGNQEPHV